MDLMSSMLLVRSAMEAVSWAVRRLMRSATPKRSRPMAKARITFTGSTTTSDSISLPL